VTTGLLKTAFLDRMQSDRKINSGTIRLGFFRWAEYQRGGKLSQLSIGYLFILTYSSSYSYWFRSYRFFSINDTVEIGSGQNNIWIEIKSWRLG
jgi:hypothetical protein